MKVIPTVIKDVVIIEHEVCGDECGYFFESYSQRVLDALVRPVRFVQDNESRYGVLRGLHFQKGKYGWGAGRQTITSLPILRNWT